jgi:phosphatidylserine/phosphatidylglycerophosphate/cardiolipin synthase-like enzyme
MALMSDRVRQARFINITAQCFLLCALIFLFYSFTTLNARADDVPAASSWNAGFSPGRSALDIVLDSIKKANHSILVAAYSFTSKPIATALLEAHRRGVKVMVVADDKGNRGRYSVITFLANHGVSVRLNSNYAIMHNKFMIIDDLHVETGSFNYTAAAVSRNAENVLLLSNMPDLAEGYKQQWLQLWNEAKILQPAY